MVKKGLLSLDEITPDIITSGQVSTMIFKKKGTLAFAHVRRFFGKKVPTYLKKTGEKPPLKHYIGALVVYLIPALFERDFISRLFVWVPTKYFNKYRNLVLKLFSK